MRWRGLKTLACVIAIVMGAIVPSVNAGPYQDALAAQERGDHGPMYRLMRKFAERGVAEAQSQLGVLYNSGQGVTENHAEALRWFRKAAEQGYAFAQYSVGLYYNVGRGGVTRDYVEAVRWYRKSAEQGYAVAQSILGTMYVDGNGVTRNIYEAFRWFRMAAERGHAAAQRSLGIMYQHGQGAVQDYGEAIRWYRGAAEKDDAKAQNGLGYLYGNGLGIVRNDAAAAHWYRRAAEQGLADAQDSLARRYKFGKGVTQDYVAAARWYRKAAEQGHVEAQFELASLHHNGQGVTQNYSEARRWFRSAADQGHAKAQFNLGLIYLDGLGATQDFAEAARWFRLAAEQGSAKAQLNLGLIFGKGLGVTQDYAVAASWFHKAAEQGNTDSQFMLAYMYGNGLGVTLDYVEAHKWSSIAAANGDTEAATFRNTLERENMTSAQFAESQRLARPWLTEEQIAALPPKQKVAEPPPNKPVAVPSRRSEKQRDSVSGRSIATIQEGLKVFDYDPGSVDGVLGPKTRAAIRAFQKEHGLQVTGAISGELVSAMGQALDDRLAEAQAEQEEREPELYGTGTGFIISSENHILTNDHVVDECVEVRVAPALAATVIARDQASDLALLKSSAGEAGAVATFRQGRGIRPGDAIVVVGYPLRSYLASEMHVTTGSVSALAGPGDDRRLFQITAPVQPGNSGGPVLDSTGNVVGVVMAKLDALKVALATGDIPQNVNFAIAAGTARAFLDTQDVPYETAPSTNELKPADVAAKARRFTVLIECWN